MDNTEKLFTGDVKMMYPKKWIVMTDLEDRSNHYSVIGIVHYVSSDEEDARKVLREIINGDKPNRAMIIEGFNDTPQIGGLWNLGANNC